MLPDGSRRGGSAYRRDQPQGAWRSEEILWPSLGNPAGRKKTERLPSDKRMSPLHICSYMTRRGADLQLPGRTRFQQAVDKASSSTTSRWHLQHRCISAPPTFRLRMELTSTQLRVSRRPVSPLSRPIIVSAFPTRQRSKCSP